MKQQKIRKLVFDKKTILHMAENANPDGWIKTTGGLTCPISLGGPLCIKPMPN